MVSHKIGLHTVVDSGDRKTDIKFVLENSVIFNSQVNKRHTINLILHQNMFEGNNFQSFKNLGFNLRTNPEPKSLKTHIMEYAILGK